MKDDRETFERDIFKPPFFARMLERSGKFTDGLEDKDAFLRIALNQFWERRQAIHSSGDVLRCWSMALRYAAVSRPRWRVRDGAFGITSAKAKWVRGSKLGEF